MLSTAWVSGVFMYIAIPSVAVGIEKSTSFILSRLMVMSARARSISWLTTWSTEMVHFICGWVKLRKLTQLLVALRVDEQLVTKARHLGHGDGQVNIVPWVLSVSPVPPETDGTVEYSTVQYSTAKDMKEFHTWGKVGSYLLQGVQFSEFLKLEDNFISLQTSYNIPRYAVLHNAAKQMIMISEFIIFIKTLNKSEQ